MGLFEKMVCFKSSSPSYLSPFHFNLTSLFDVTSYLATRTLPFIGSSRKYFLSQVILSVTKPYLAMMCYNEFVFVTICQLYDKMHLVNIRFREEQGPFKLKMG